VEIVAGTGDVQVGDAPTQKGQSRQIDNGRLQVAVTRTAFLSQFCRLGWIVVSEHVVSAQEDDATLRQSSWLVHLSGVDPTMER